MFPPGKSVREIWDFEIFRFSGNFCRDPGKCFYICKDFSGTDIYHSDIKNALLQILILFFSYKNYFSKLSKFLRQNACEIKIFSSIVENIEKLKLSLSKQHHKMLKMKSEMLKTRKKAKQSSSRNFPGNCPNSGNPENLGIP